MSPDRRLRPNPPSHEHHRPNRPAVLIQSPASNSGHRPPPRLGGNVHWCGGAKKLAAGPVGPATLTSAARLVRLSGKARISHAMASRLRRLIPTAARPRASTNSRDFSCRQRKTHIRRRRKRRARRINGSDQKPRLSGHATLRRALLSSPLTPFSFSYLRSTAKPFLKLPWPV